VVFNSIQHMLVALLLCFQGPTASMGLYVDSGSIYETQQNTGEQYSSSISSQHSNSAAVPTFCAAGSHPNGCMGGASSCQLLQHQQPYK
jgi:hypothetical protein